MKLTLINKVNKILSYAVSSISVGLCSFTRCHLALLLEEPSYKGGHLHFSHKLNLNGLVARV